MTNRVFAILLILLPGVLFVGQSAANEVQPTGIRKGSFVQQKHFAQFPRPFVSSGTFLMDAHSLVWQTLKPVLSRLEITADGVFVVDGDGNRTEQKGAEPYIQSLKGLIGGDLTGLKTRFTVTALEQDDCYRLVPGDKLLAELFADFELCLAAGEVSSVRLNEVGGNYTLIELKDDEEAGQ